MPLLYRRPCRPRRLPPPTLAPESLESRRLMAVTVFADGFEAAALSGWTTRTYEGDAAKWGVNSVKRYTGTRSAFVAGPGRNAYESDQHTGMQRQNVSLRGYGTASLTFKYYLNTEAGYDFFSVNVIDDRGKATTLFRDSGDERDRGWRSKTISLNDFAGRSDVDVEFRFDSDASLVNDAPSGVWVDDVKLTATTKPATATIRGSVFDDADGDHVRDPGEKPLSGWVVYLDQNQNRRRDANEWWRVTDAAGRYAFGGVAPGTHYVAQELRPGYVQTAPVKASSTAASQFNIGLGFDPSLTSSQRSAFNAAARRWAQVIVGDLADVRDDGLVIDDVHIDVAAREIDGRGGMLAQASPSAYREGAAPGGNLPYRGFVEIDSADIAALESAGQLLDVLTHEMAHVLGFGTAWEQAGLLRDTGGTNPRFTGAVATAQYNAIFGRNETGVPVENDGGPGTHDTHWRESVFGSELLTGYIDKGKNPISRVTVGSLADLGYVVDLAAADAYAAAGRPPVPVPAGVVHVVTVSAGQTRSSADFGNRTANRAPTIGSLAASGGAGPAGSTFTLTAARVGDDGSVSKVGFYRESNSVAGLQTGSGGDVLVGTDSNAAGGYAVNVGTTGLAAGTYTYYALATDNAGATSATGTAAVKATRTVQSIGGSVSGTVYRDADNDGARDSGEVGLAGVMVFADANNNGRRDASERSGVSDATGRYTLTALAAGSHTIRFVTPVNTLPSSRPQVVKIGAGQSLTGRDLGAVPAGKISGRIFNDLDRDGVRDANEAGAAGFRVYLDADGDGRFDAGEASVIVGVGGTYSFGNLRPGPHAVRYVPQGGWANSYVYSNYSITLGVGQNRTGVNFGVTRTA